jgi:hypothetical protein
MRSTVPHRSYCRLLIIFTLLTVPKGGWEASDVVLEAAASREALEEGLNLCSSLRLLTT